MTKSTGTGALGTMLFKEPIEEWQDKLSARKVIKMSKSTQNYFCKQEKQINKNFFVKQKKSDFGDVVLAPREVLNPSIKSNTSQAAEEDIGIFD